MFVLRRTVSRLSNALIKRNLTTHDGHLEIAGANGQPLKFHYFWLRDHCRCPECWNEPSIHMNLNICDVDLDIKPKKCEETNEKLLIEWPDGHKSQFDLHYLRNVNIIQKNGKVASNKKSVFWDAEKAKGLQDKMTVKAGDYFRNDDGIKSLAEKILTYGVGFVSEVEPTPKATEQVISRLAMIKKTMFGEVFEISTTGLSTYADTAYQNIGLYVHTDNIYYTDPAGLQCFHLMSHDGEGGETTLVDGFKAANELRAEDPKSFDALCEHAIPTQYTDIGYKYTNIFPPLKVHPLTKEVFHLRMNILDRDTMNTIPHEHIMEFYKAYQKLAKKILDPKNTWAFKLQPGTVILIDNWRVLHGRKEFSGMRRLTGCYVPRDDFISRANRCGLPHY